MEEKINGIAKDLCEIYGGHKDYVTCGDCFGEKDGYCGCKNLAESLYLAGYRKTSSCEKANLDSSVKSETIDKISIFGKTYLLPKPITLTEEERRDSTTALLVTMLKQLCDECDNESGE